MVTFSHWDYQQDTGAEILPNGAMETTRLGDAPNTVLAPIPAQWFQIQESTPKMVVSKWWLVQLSYFSSVPSTDGDSRGCICRASAISDTVQRALSNSGASLNSTQRRRRGQEVYPTEFTAKYDWTTIIIN
jgi:hypothetical protein